MFRFSASPVLLGAVLMAALPFGGCARAQTAPAILASAPKGADVIGVVFDPKPVENGLTFDRANVKPGVLEIKGEKHNAWVATKNVEPDPKWTRSFRFKITDPRFQNGKRPAVDLEIVYFQKADVPVNVRVDSATGSRRIGGGKGNTKEWKTLDVRLDDAFFGARAYPDAKGLSTSGFDLRVDGGNSDLWLRSVKLVGYNTTENVDWNRMLKISDTRGAVPGGLLAFPRAARSEVDVEVANLAAIARPLRYEMRVAGYDNKTRFAQKGEVNVAPSGASQLPFALDTRAWPLGPYSGKIAFYLDEKTEPVFEEEFGLGVVSDTVLPKARAGEFLFGLDAANSDIMEVHDATSLAYYRLMGVDILRNVYSKSSQRDLAGTGAALQLLARENLQAAIMARPPRPGDSEDKNAAELKKVTAQLEEMARLYAGDGPGKLHFWELGNEPDLPFFYPGTMQQYAATMGAMYDAIKRGAAGKPTMVMNGGLSFAGNAGDARSRAFVQIVDPKKLDIIAYHGHGPGIKAERGALERVREVAVKYGKADLGFIETESGYAAKNRVGLEEQARTAVEKMTYAQSQGLPTFFFFRLYMEGTGAYGLTDERVQPRPSVLSYRNMVERLRHHVFVESLPFADEAGAPGVNAFLFEERGADGRATGRKTLVAFSEKAASYNLSLRLDEAATRVGEAQTFDMYGNAAPAQLLPGNVAQLRVGEEPVYLTWSSAGATRLARAMPSLLSLEAGGRVLAGASNSLSVTVRNLSAQPMPVEVSVEARSRLPIQVEPKTRQLTLPASGAATIPLDIKLGAADAPLALPQWWKVFASVDDAQIGGPQLADVPETLPGKNGAVAGRYLATPDNSIDVGAFAGGQGEKRSALAYATIDAPRALNLPVAAAADWWTVWYVNGQKVYDGLDEGGGTLADHLFELPLRAGRNVVVAQVLSGAHGWKLEFGGPAQRQLASQNTLADEIRVTLKSGAQVLAEQAFGLSIATPVPPLGAAKANDTLDRWMALEPLAVLGAEELTNFWVKEPDQSCWYGGDQDLSAQVWLRDDGANIHLFVAVTDDKQRAGDALRAVIADDAGAVQLDATATLRAERSALELARGNGKATTVRSGERTLYHLEIPRGVVGQKPFRLNLALADDDEGFAKQTLNLGDVAQPEAGLRLALP